MRVAFAAFEAFPNHKGAGTRITQTLTALAEAGHDVHLISLPPRTNTPLPAGVTHHPLRAFASNYLERALGFRGQVARRLRTLAPDVVHVRGIFEGQAAAEHADARGIPFVFEVNGLPSVELRYHYRAVAEAHDFEVRLRATERRLLERADRVITQSRTTLAFLHDRGLPLETPAHVVPNGADPELWRPAGAGGGIVYAGTLSAWQGVAELLMAQRRLVRLGHAPRLTLIGRASRRRRKQLERMVRKLKIGDHVSLPGALPLAQLAEHVTRADICVAPLRRDIRNRVQGCSPIKLFEYLAAGRAVLTTDLPCVREIVGEDRAAIVHAPRPARLAEQLAALLDGPTRRTELGARGRAWVIAEATWQKRREAIQAVYASLASLAVSAPAAEQTR